MPVNLLPTPNPNGIHLSKYGYSTSKKQSKRRESLKRSSRKHGALPVLRRLNLIRNLTSVRTSEETKKSHDIMSKDVEFMKKMYEGEKGEKGERGEKNKLSRTPNKKSRKHTKK